MDNTTYRNLTPDEILQLERQGNYADDWSALRVTDPFCPDCIRNSTFLGAVSPGSIQQQRHTDGALALPEGIYGSTLANPTLGNHPAVHNVRMLSRYTIGNDVPLFTAADMPAPPHHPAGLEPMSETGGRRILPFAGMTIADAYLWARYRGHKALMEKLEQYTRTLLDSPEGHYCPVGANSVEKTPKAATTSPPPPRPPTPRASTPA